MSCNRKFFSSIPGVLVLFLLLVAWTLPAHAERQQLSNRAGGQYLAASSGEYADFPAANTRGYPPRQHNAYEDRDYADKRGNRNKANTRTYNDGYSSGQYGDREPVTRQKPYSGSRGESYSTGSQGNRRFQENRGTVTEKRRYYNGERIPQSSGAQGNRSYAQDRGSANGQRRYSRSRKTPYSSEYRASGKPADSQSRHTRDTSLDDAVSRVRRQSEGRVLSAETVRKNNREEHRVRVITDDGRVRRYRMDAETGDILPRKP